MFKVYLFLSMMLLMCSIYGLFQVRYQLDSVSRALNTVFDDIYFVSEEVGVLDTELSYVSRPSRIEHLANSYLAMHPIRVHQVFREIGADSTVVATDEE